MNAIPDNFLTEESIFPIKRCKYCHEVMDLCVCEELYNDDKGDE